MKLDVRRVLACGVVISLAVLGAACTPIMLTGGGGSTSCPEGSWVLSSESVSGLVSTGLGNLTVTPTGNSVTLAINNDKTWTLNAAGQQVAVSGSSPFGTINVNATVNATASGTWTSTATTISFTLNSVSGSASYSGTLNGHPVQGTLTLPQLGDDSEHFYGLTGTANSSCGSNSLTLTFTKFRMDLDH